MVKPLKSVTLGQTYDYLPSCMTSLSCYRHRIVPPRIEQQHTDRYVKHDVIHKTGSTYVISQSCACRGGPSRRQKASTCTENLTRSVHPVFRLYRCGLVATGRVHVARPVESHSGARESILAGPYRNLIPTETRYHQQL